MPDCMFDRGYSLFQTRDLCLHLRSMTHIDSGFLKLSGELQILWRQMTLIISCIGSFWETFFHCFMIGFNKRFVSFAVTLLRKYMKYILHSKCVVLLELRVVGELFPVVLDFLRCLWRFSEWAWASQSLFRAQTLLCWRSCTHLHHGRYFFTLGEQACSQVVSVCCLIVQYFPWRFFNCAFAASRPNYNEDFGKMVSTSVCLLIKLMRYMLRAQSSIEISWLQGNCRQGHPGVRVSAQCRFPT